MPLTHNGFSIAYHIQLSLLNCFIPLGTQHPHILYKSNYVVIFLFDDQIYFDTSISSLTCVWKLRG
jgi:hypothetical protein